MTVNSISIGLIRDLSGPVGGHFMGFVPSAGTIALQNAEGGVDGRKIRLIVKNDATNQAFLPVPSSGRPICGKDLLTPISRRRLALGFRDEW